MSTLQQQLFPKPKPKDVITPLTPKATADAIREKHKQASVPPECEKRGRGRPPKQTSSSNSLLRETESSEE